jgi:uncharacterized protein (TIGR03435 family)
MTMNDLISQAYAVEVRQIVGALPWMESDRFDLTIEPDVQGIPSFAQAKILVQEVLAQRFQLKFHSETRALPAYVLMLGKREPKLTRSETSDYASPSLFFTGWRTLPARHATMQEFTAVLQGILDRPVVDQTGIKGRWDFTLKWTPDESQPAKPGQPGSMLAPTDDSPPDLFTAIQQQLGLKLVSAKAPVRVMVVDHVEKPTPN